jgi:hypothetical protein
MITNSKLQVLPATSDNANLFLSLQPNSAGLTNTILSATALTYNPFSRTLSLNGIRWPAADGTAGQVLRTDGAGNLTFGNAGLQNFTDALSTSGTNATVAVASLTATNAGYANIDHVIAVKGTGAILAQVPDGTTAGGNKRGQYAVDLQMSRTIASQVAGGGYSVIVGGERNATNPAAWASFIGSGRGNNIIASGGGFDNQFIGAGNDNSISWSANSAIVGGSSNRIGNSNVYSFTSFIGGGQSNIINGENNAISGGVSNTVTTGFSIVGAGESNGLFNLYGAIVGGFTNSTVSAFQTVTFYSQTGVSRIALDSNNANIFSSMVIKSSITQNSPGTLTVTGYANAGTSFATSSGSGNGTTYTLIFAGSATVYDLNSWITIAGVTLTSGTINGTFVVTGSSANSVSFANLSTGTISSQGTVRQSTTVTTATAATATFNPGTVNIYKTGTFIGAGGNNQAQGSYSVIVGGGDVVTAVNRNSIGNNNAHGVIVGGRGNTISGTSQFSGILGGLNNTISSAPSDLLAPGTGHTIAGGVGNTISGPTFQGGTPNFIGGGQNNTISGNYHGHVIVGGSDNQGAAGGNTFNTFIGGGANNFVSNSYSTIPGGQFNRADASYSSVFGGVYGTTRTIVGYTVFPASDRPFGASSAGLSQTALLILGRQTTDASPAVLVSNNVTASATNQIALPSNSAYYVRGSVIATVTGGGATKAWTFEVVIKKALTNATTAIVGTSIINITAADTGAATWIIALTADTTNGALAITVTGQVANTIRWVCRAETTEVTF